MAAWDAFADSWNDLGLDRFMADGGRYRKRRFAAFSASPDGVTRKPHQPHYQSRDYNGLNGGVQRWFEPVTEAIADHPVTQGVLAAGLALFHPLTVDPPARWHVELHQFRIEAGDGEAGLPTPEGAHRDGVDWVIVMLVERCNVASGVTDIFAGDGARLGAFTLEQPPRHGLPRRPPRAARRDGDPSAGAGPAGAAGCAGGDVPAGVGASKKVVIPEASQRLSGTQGTGLMPCGSPGSRTSAPRFPG